jgi:hypothetical protein
MAQQIILENQYGEVSENFIINSPPFKILGYTPPAYKEVDTYALMIADGTPAVSTLYKVLSDENKNYVNSFYIWWSSGKRLWCAATDDN